MDDYQYMLNEINFSMSSELYIVNSEGCLIELTCPFLVVANESVGNLTNGLYYQVLSVKMNIRFEAVFEIQGSYYLYKSFDL